MEKNSSLDPLGPQFGKINAPAINTQSLLPFEGDTLRDNKINFFPVTPPLTTTNPNYPIQDGITGHAPGVPSSRNPRKKINPDELKNAINQSIQMDIETHRDKNQYARVNAYNAGPTGSSFYKRYAAYGQKKFDEVGFSPLRNNEAMFNAHTTVGDDFTRMMKNSFVPLFTRGFVAGPKSLIKMMQGDFSADTEDARAYENAAAIGQSSKKGMGAFFSNTAMNFGYTAGILTESILEEVAGAALSPFTAGGSFFAATANNARKIGKIGSAFDIVTDGYKAINATLKEANSIEGARKMWKAAENIGKSKVGKFLNPLENTFDAIIGVGKNADNLTGLARLAQSTNKTAGGLFRDIRNINMALSEARLEGGMTENAVYDKAYDAFYKRNGRAPNNNEQYEMTKTAKEAGMNTLMWNSLLIFASNKVVIPNLLKSGISKSALQAKIDDVFAMKGGKIAFEKTTEAGKKVATGKFEFVEDTFKNALKGFKAAPIRTTAKLTGRYLKANLMEGVQENLQEVISSANEKYYLNTYKNKELGAHLYNRGQSSLMYEGLKDQFSAQGFETFASGALMGLFSGGLNVAKGAIDYGYNNTFNKAKYQEYKALKKSHGEGVADRLTKLYSDPKEFFNARIFNYGVQNNAITDSDDAATKQLKDLKRETFASQVFTALDTNTINYFKDHIASFKDVSPEEFEEAFGFEQGTGAQEQQKIDKILNNIDTMQKSYEYANERFPNPIDLTKYDKATPEYTSAAILERAWSNGIKNYVVFNDAYMDAIDRMTKVSGTIINNPSMKNMSQLDMDLIFQPSKIANEALLLKNEIASLKDAKDPSLKDQIKEKQDKLDALNNFSLVYNKRNQYYNRTTSKSIIDAYKKETGIEELSEEEEKNILDIAFGEKTDENNYKIDAELELAYKNFLKASVGIDKDYIFDTDIDESYNKLLDYYELNNESKSLVTYINILHNPEGFLNQVQKAQTWMNDMYNNRKDYYTDMVNKQIAAMENNALLNALADKNIFIDLDAFQAYMEDDILPEEFINETTKQVIPKGTREYDEIFSLLSENKRLKSEDVNKPTLDNNLQSEIDRLDAQEKNEIEALPKVESITILKKEVAKEEPFTLKDIYSKLDEYQYVDAIYKGTDQKVTMYEAFDGLKLNDASGESIDADTSKDKFSEYTIYKKSLKADPEQVKAINDKYDNLRDEVAEKYAKKKAKTKADIYSNYTPVDELPADLYKELQETFQQTETAMTADENEVSSEEYMDLFKTFVKNNPLAEQVIDEYNDKSKQEVEKEKLGEIDDFDFVLNNKKLNTANYSNDDIKIFKKDFEKLRDASDKLIEQTSYQSVIDKFDKLLATRQVQTYSPEVQDIIKVLKDKLLGQQNKISKQNEEGYLVDGNLLDRVSNFIQQFKTEKYKYNGHDIIKKAFNSTIGAAGMSPSIIDSFLKQLRLNLHVDSVKGDYGYIDDTEAIIKKHLNNLLKDNLYKKQFKDNEEFLEDIQALISENAYEASRFVGTYIDEQLRRLFTKGEAPIFDEKKISKEAFDNLFGPTGFLKEIKQKVDSGELYTLATNLKLYDIDANVAGEMDLLLIDKQGKLHIIDFKTGKKSKWDDFVTKSGYSINKIEDYTLQQYTYARLLKKMTGLDADINILPIETVLDQNNKKITDANAPTNPKLTGVGKWYFSLDPNFSDAKTKIDNAILLEAPGLKVATEINPKLKTRLNNMGYKNAFIKSLDKSEIERIVKEAIPYEEYIKETSVSSLTFGETTTNIDAQIADIKRREQEELNSIIPIKTSFGGGQSFIKDDSITLNLNWKDKEQINFLNKVFGQPEWEQGKEYPTYRARWSFKNIPNAKNIILDIQGVKITTDTYKYQVVLENIDKLINAKYNAELAALQIQTGPVTKASELNLQKDDTVIVNQPIMEKNEVFAPQGATLTVLKSDEKSVSFTYENKEKTLTLPEMDKHVTTMEIEEVKQAEKTQEVLDAIDKQTVTETINALTDFIGDKDAIKKAIDKASSNNVTAENLTNQLLDNLECQ